MLFSYSHMLILTFFARSLVCEFTNEKFQWQHNNNNMVLITLKEFTTTKANSFRADSTSKWIVILVTNDRALTAITYNHNIAYYKNDTIANSDNNNSNETKNTKLNFSINATSLSVKVMPVSTLSI